MSRLLLKTLEEAWKKKKKTLLNLVLKTEVALASPLSSRLCFNHLLSHFLVYFPLLLLSQ